MNCPPFLRRTLLALALSLLSHSSVWAQAPAYPTRAVSIIVGTEPGGAPDILARLLATRLSDKLGKQFIVENKPGAAGMVGARLAANAPADGHTLFLGTVATNAIVASAYKQPGYDPASSFAPVSMIASVPLIVVVNPTLGVSSIDEFVRLAKSKPGALNYSTPGIGGPQHLSTELFAAKAGIKLVHIPYKGGAGAVQAVLANEVAVFFSGMPPALPHIRADKLKALAVTTKARASAAPTTPTIGEAGYPGFEADNWHALFAPAKTPDAIVAKLNEALTQILALPEVREQMLRSGAEAMSSTPAALRDFVEIEIRKWAQVVKEAGIEPQ